MFSAQNVPVIESVLMDLLLPRLPKEQAIQKISDLMILLPFTERKLLYALITQLAEDGADKPAIASAYGLKGLERAFLKAQRQSGLKS